MKIEINKTDAKIVVGLLSSDMDKIKNRIPNYEALSEDGDSYWIKCTNAEKKKLIARRQLIEKIESQY